MDKIKKIFAKGSFTQEDMNFLMVNKHLLTNDHLVKLGLAPTPLVVSEPVKIELVLDTSSIVPKKRGRPRKILI